MNARLVGIDRTACFFCPHAYDLEIQHAMLNNVSTLKCFSSSEGRGGLLEEL